MSVVLLAEADMRAVTELFVTEEALAAMYAQAAPFTPRPPAPPIYLANEKWTWRTKNGPFAQRPAEADLR